jgi:uncharacterized membrane protein YsdA (DUF1294 family)
MDNVKYAIVIYFAVISVIGWCLPAIDKRKAKSGSWRIPEKTLFIVSALGGSVAMLISMKVHHHKTLHKRFMIGIPCIIIIQLIVAAFIVYLYMGDPLELLNSID